MQNIKLYEIRELKPEIQKKLVSEYQDWFSKLSYEIVIAIHYIFQKYKPFIDDNDKLFSVLNNWKLDTDITKKKVNMRAVIIFIKMYLESKETRVDIDKLFAEHILSWKNNMENSDYQLKFMTSEILNKFIQPADLSFNGGFLEDGRMLRY